MVKLGADLIGVNVAYVGMTEAVEHVQGVPPGVAGGICASNGMVGIAKIVVADGLAVAVCKFGPQVERLLIVGYGLLIVAKVVVSVAKAVQGVALTATVADLLI